MRVIISKVYIPAFSKVVLMWVNKKILIIIVLLIIPLFLIGCGSKTQVSTAKVCKSNTDCTTTQICKTSTCESGKCVIKTKDNCCGNAKCEVDLGETKCGCKTDCGTCNGTILLTASPKTYSKYISMQCDKTNACIASSNPLDVKNKEFLNQFSSGNNFKFNIYTYYDIPFDIDKSLFVLEFKMTDVDQTLIKTPLAITEVRIMEGNTIIGRNSDKIYFSKVSDSKKITIIPTYDMVLPEESKSGLSVNIDYEYTPYVKVTNPTTKIVESIPATTPERLTYKFTITDKIVMISPKLVP